MENKRHKAIGDSFRNRPSFMDRVKGALGYDEEEKKKKKEEEKSKRGGGPKLNKDKTAAFMKSFSE